MNGIVQPWVCTRCASSLTRRLRPISLTATLADQRRAYTAKVHAHNRRNGLFRMAVIGSGPAGFYTAYKVLSKIDNAMVDMYEQLPVPFGLVRFGVAPDHPEVKNCQDKFEEVASQIRFNFIGNVTIGEEAGSLPLRSILPHYDAICFAYGASKDRTLGIPGEEKLKGIYSARAFVGWYNGLPEYAGLDPDLTLGEEATIIGQGNVALDVARILLQDPDALKHTDITRNALETLQKSRVKRVRIVGRRGPLQAAFTIKEVRELVKIPSLAFHPVDQSLIPEDIKQLPRPPRRIMEVLQKGSEATIETAPKSWSLDFCLSPTSFNPSQASPSQLDSMTFEKTSLEPGPFDPRARAIGTGEPVKVPTSLAFRSIGYKSEALPEFLEAGIPFDDRLGIIPNDNLGRVTNEKEGIKTMPGLYCAGWVKRGPTGVIASTMEDAFSTADSIVEDWYGHAPLLNDGAPFKDGWFGVKPLAAKRGCRPVHWDNWRDIDNAEKARGRIVGKPREKFTSIEEMLAVRPRDLHKIV